MYEIAQILVISGCRSTAGGHGWYYGRGRHQYQSETKEPEERRAVNRQDAFGRRDEDI